MEDPCKCEARLAFQKKTQAAIQQLTAKHILSVVSDGKRFIINSLCSTFAELTAGYLYLLVLLLEYNLTVRLVYFQGSDMTTNSHSVFIT